MGNRRKARAPHLALAFEDYHRNATEADHEALRALAEKAEPGILGRLTRASLQAHQVATAYGVLSGATRTETNDYEAMPEWVRLGMHLVYAGLATGEIETCPHVAPGAPIYAAAWKPGLVVCGLCTIRLAAPDPIADATCDACGHVCDVEHGDLIQAAFVVYNSLTYQFGVCDRCPVGVGA